MTHRFLRLAATKPRDPPVEPTEPAILKTYINFAITLCQSAVQLRFRGHSPPHDTVEHLLVVPVATIIWHTYYLCRMIREDITSSQYWPFYPELGQPYNITNMKPAAHSEPLGDVRDSSGQVVSVLRLGLVYSSPSLEKKEGVAVKAEVLVATPITSEGIAVEE